MKYLALAIASFWTGLAAAGPLEDCVVNATGSLGETGCYAAEFERLNKTLEAKHKAMLEALTSDLQGFDVKQERIQWLKKKANEAHEYWKKYRATYCGEFTYESIQGSGASAAAVHCNIQLTNHRIVELEGY